MWPLLLAAQPTAEHSAAKPVTTSLRGSAIAMAVGLGGLLILGTVVFNALRVGWRRPRGPFRATSCLVSFAGFNGMGE